MNEISWHFFGGQRAHMLAENANPRLVSTSCGLTTGRSHLSEPYHGENKCIKCLARAAIVRDQQIARQKEEFEETNSFFDYAYSHYASSTGKQTKILKHYSNGFWATSRCGTWASAEFYEYKYTMLVKCQLCGFTSTPKKVCCRNDVWGWNLDRTISGAIIDYSQECKHVLCVSCWNKVRPINKARVEAQETHTEINRLKREIQKWQKSQQQASSENTSHRQSQESGTEQSRQIRQGI